MTHFIVKFPPRDVASPILFKESPFSFNFFYTQIISLTLYRSDTILCKIITALFVVKFSTMELLDFVSYVIVDSIVIPIFLATPQPLIGASSNFYDQNFSKTTSYWLLISNMDHAKFVTIKSYAAAVFPFSFEKHASPSCPKAVYC